MAGRFEAVLDFGCGTATSATLYYLLFYPRAIAIGIDRDCNKKWVEEHLPPSLRSRFFFVSEDAGKLTIEKLEVHVREHMHIGLSKVTRVHWSPSCRSLSRASRGHHRDAFGLPLTELARQEDATFARQHLRGDGQRRTHDFCGFRVAAEALDQRPRDLRVAHERPLVRRAAHCPPATATNEPLHCYYCALRLNYHPANTDRSALQHERSALQSVSMIVGPPEGEGNYDVIFNKFCNLF